MSIWILVFVTVNQEILGECVNLQFESSQNFTTAVADIHVLLKNPLVLSGFMIVLVITFLAILAPVIAPYDPLEQHMNSLLLSPSWQFPMGTDELGRCVLSRLLHGTRLSLQIALAIVLITGLAGTLIGMISGYLEGIIDEIIMRIVDIFLAFPGLILALVIAGLLGPGLFNTMLALSIVGWTRYARIARGVTLTVKKRAFVESARSLGCSTERIILTHVLPEVASPAIVMATLGMGWAIIMAASLSFLGLGAQPPSPEWGAMLNSGKNFIRVAPHLCIFPGIAIVITVLAFNFLGDGLRDALDPRLKTKLELK